MTPSGSPFAETLPAFLAAVKEESGITIDNALLSEMKLEAILDYEEGTLNSILEAMGLPEAHITVLSDALNGRRAVLRSLETQYQQPPTPMEDEDLETLLSASTGAAVNNTPFRGLLNQGATCYLNSLLQTYFHLPAFRRAVFELPTRTQEYAEVSLPLALQRLFYEMSCLHRKGDLTDPVSTSAITSSLGFSREETALQQDIDEMNGKLFDALEGAECTAPRLFTGAMREEITVAGADYQSHASDIQFRCLPLEVQGCPDIEASFKRMQRESLDGFHVEGQSGECTARKDTYLVNLPMVLLLSLKRFVYDRETHSMQKVMDDYRFHLDLDLKQALPDRPEEGGGSDPTPETRYTLHSVLVHQGNSTTCGHYVSYVRRNQKTWYKFNDENVAEATDEDAIDKNWSGRSSAYMLVYLRVDSYKDVLCEEDVPEVDSIPRELRYRFIVQDLEIAQVQEPTKRSDIEDDEIRAWRELQDKHNTFKDIRVRFVTDEIVREHVNRNMWGIVDVDRLPATHNATRHRDDMFQVLQEDLERFVPTGCMGFRVWTMERLSDRNGHWSPTQYVDRTTVGTLPLVRLLPAGTDKDDEPKYLVLFIEAMGAVLQSQPDDESEVFLSYKFFNRGTVGAGPSPLQYVTSRLFFGLLPLHMLADELSVEVPDGSSLLAWHEYDKGDVRPLDTTADLTTLRLRHGDIVIFEAESSDGSGPAATAVVEDDTDIQNAKQYLEWSTVQRFVSFASMDEPCLVVRELQLADPMSYAVVQQRLCRALDLGCDPRCIQFRPSSAATCKPFLYSGHVKLKNMLDKTRGTDKLYYEVMGAPLEECAEELVVRVVYPTEYRYCNVTVHLPADSAVQDIVEATTLITGDQEAMLVYTFDEGIRQLVTRDQPIDKTAKYQLQPYPPQENQTVPFCVLFASSLSRLPHNPDFPPFIWYFGTHTGQDACLTLRTVLTTDNRRPVVDTSDAVSHELPPPPLALVGISDAIRC